MVSKWESTKSFTRHVDLNLVSFMVSVPWDEIHNGIRVPLFRILERGIWNSMGQFNGDPRW
jgi:hypothetical protein